MTNHSFNGEKSMFKRYFLSLAVLLAFLYCPVVFAAGSGGYRVEVPDAAAVGKGSAFTGEANDPSAVYYNPAGMTQLKGNNLSLGLSIIQPKSDYVNGAGTIKNKMGRDSFLIPEGFFVTDLGTKDFALGLGAMSSWGLVTDWGQTSSLRYSTTRAEIANQDYLITTAYKVNDQFSLALGLDIDDSNVDKQKKLQQGPAGVTAFDGNFKLKGSDTAAGFRIAGLYKLNDQNQFGLMYRSAIQHKYKGKIHLDGLNTNNVVDLNGDGTPESNYQGIFGGASYQTEVVSKATLPDSLVLGYSFKPTNKWTFNADLEWMNWSVVNEEELAYPSESDPSRLAVLNNGNPVARDWQSVISAAVGAQYDVSDRFRVRGGYYHHQSPVPGDNWEPNLPDTVSHGITTGFGYDIRKDLTLDLAWSGIYYMPRDIDNTVNGGNNNGTYKQWTNLLYATMTYKF